MSDTSYMRNAWLTGAVAITAVVVVVVVGVLVYLSIRPEVNADVAQVERDITIQLPIGSPASSVVAYMESRGYQPVGPLRAGFDSAALELGGTVESQIMTGKIHNSSRGWFARYDIWLTFLFDDNLLLVSFSVREISQN
jgi:hypothetical protein